MYAEFFSLQYEPFPVTPDASHLYLSDTHKEALASLFHGVERRRGFVQIVGEVGTGKTTIVRAFLSALDRELYTTVVVLDPHMSFAELLHYMTRELGETTDAEGYALVSQVQGRLIEEYKAGRNVVLVVDEAHNMPVRTLELLRMLSNVETDEQKLIQIVLAGQPELDSVLARRELRQLRQRIGIRAVIEPLDDADAQAYLEQHIARAGGAIDSVLSPGARSAIVAYARGIPRMLNMAADAALIHAFGAQQRPASAALAADAISSLPRLGAGARQRWRVAAVAASVALVAAAAWYLTDDARAPGASAHAGPAVASMTATVDARQEPVRTLTVPPAATPAPGPGLPATTGPPEQPALTAVGATTEKADSAAASIETATPPDDAGAEHSDRASTVGEDAASAVTVPAAIEAAPTPHGAGTVRIEPALATELMALQRERIKWDLTPLPDDFYPVVHTVRSGDLFSQLCFDVYGFAAEELYDFLRAANPSLTSVDALEPGHRITFPALPPALQRLRQSHIDYKIRTAQADIEERP